MKSTCANIPTLTHVHVQVFQPSRVSSDCKVRRGANSDDRHFIDYAPSPQRGLAQEAQISESKNALSSPMLFSRCSADSVPGGEGSPPDPSQQHQHLLLRNPRIAYATARSVCISLPMCINPIFSTTFTPCWHRTPDRDRRSSTQKRRHQQFHQKSTLALLMVLRDS